MAYSNDHIELSHQTNKMAASDDNEAASGNLYDVVIVGAGLAGLAAAHNLLKKDPTLKLLVLEARDRVGGRTFTKPMKVHGGKTDDFDFGAQWVGLTQHHILRLMKQLNIEMYPQFRSGTKVTQLGSSTARTFETDAPTIGSWWAHAEYRHLLRKFDRMSTKVEMLDPYSSELAYELEGLTVAAYSAQQLWTRAAKDAVEQTVKAIIGTDASRCGMLFFLAYTNASGGMGQLLGVKESAQEFRVKNGTQQISESMADMIGREKVVLSEAVTVLDQTSEKDTILVTYRHNNAATDVLEGPPKVLRARKVIMTSPPNILTKVTWNPPLNPLKLFLSENLHMGHLYKFIVTYEKAYWREKGYSGEIFSSGGGKINTECSTGPLCEVYDTTTFDGAPAIVGFIAGRTGIEWRQKTQEERGVAVINGLADCLGPEMKSFIAYEDMMWGTDPWAGGCPVTYGTPGTMFAMPQIRTPHGGVHFAGTETATVWMGYMSGAVQSGERAAWEVLADLKPELLTEDQLREASETRNVRGQFIAQPPTSIVPWKTLTVITAAVAALAAFWIAKIYPTSILKIQ